MITKEPVLDIQDPDLPEECKALIFTMYVLIGFKGNDGAHYMWPQDWIESEKADVEFQKRTNGKYKIENALERLPENGCFDIEKNEPLLINIWW